MLASRLHAQWSKSVFLAAVFAVALFPLPALSAPRTTDAVQFDVPGNRSASDILPPELISGPHFRVRDKVVFYGYMYNYVVDSDFGTFEATGDFALRKLIHEIDAIAALEQIKKGEAYLDGIKNAAYQPIEFGKDLLTDPVDTVSGVPHGIAALFRNVKAGITAPSSPGEDGKMEQILAVSSNKRQLAQRLEVDVYSSNSVLQKELNSVAWATSLGSLTVSAALAPIGGPAVVAVSATRAVQQVRDVITQFPPSRVRQINQEELLAMGIPSELATRFLDHPFYTPTQDTVIVSALKALPQAAGRDAFLRQALTADDEEMTNFFMYVAETMRGYQTKVSPIKNIHVYGPLVFARASNGTAIIPLPLDYAIWTERGSQLVSDTMASYRATNPDVKKYEFWLTGTASKLARKKAGALGIKTVEKVGDQIEFTY